VGADIRRGEWCIELAQVCNRKSLVSQLALRPAKDGEILRGVGMAVFKPSKGYPPAIYAPAAAHCQKCVGCCPAAFVEAIEREKALARLQVREFFDSEIFGRLLEDHDGLELVTPHAVAEAASSRGA